MIGVDGQYFAKVSIEGKEDFLTEEDLILFKLQEETGNVLPRFELQFLTSDQSLIQQLNEGNTVSVALGRTMNDSNRIEATIQIVLPQVNKQSQDKTQVHLLGVYKNLAYTNNPSTEITDKMTGMEVVQKYASQNWEVDIEPATSDDEKMPWMKQFTTNKKMVDKALLHMLLNTGVPICGITSTGQFIVRNVADLKSAEPLWNFTRDPQGEKDIFFDGDPKTVDEGTYNNSTSNYGRSVRVFDTITGTSKVIEYKGKPQLSQTASLPRSKDIQMIPGTNEFRTNNVHPDYELAKLKNITELTSMSSVRTAITVPRMFFPIKVVDPVTLSDKGIGAGATLTDMAMSGTRITTKVCRIIANRQFSTYVEMVVESINAPKGNFLDLGGIDAILESLTARIKGIITPANNSTTGIIDKLVDKLSGGGTSGGSGDPTAGDRLRDLAKQEINGIPRPDGSPITDDMVSNLVDDSWFDTSTKGAKDLVDSLGGLGDDIQKLVTDSVDNMTGGANSAIGGMGRYNETPVNLQPSPGQSDGGSIGPAGGGGFGGNNDFGGNHVENVIDMYNQPPDIDSVPQSVIEKTMDGLATTLDDMSNNAKDSITNGIKDGANDVIDGTKDGMKDGLKDGIIDGLQKIDPNLPGDYLDQVKDAVDNAVDSVFDNDSIISDLAPEIQDITDTIDDTIQDCTNSLIQGGQAGADVASLFPTDVKPGVMTPTTKLNVWRCDGI